MKEQSSYNSTENINITYLLGAGASYNSLPIWREQGESMIEVGNKLLGILKHSNDLLMNNKTKKLHDNKVLVDLSNRLIKYGKSAIEFGSIDIYAKRLHLIGDTEQLNDLKYCLSVYFDLWENYFYSLIDLRNGKKLEKIDKRYLNLLSIILEKNGQKPKLNQQISFITWNYDLQLEMAYKSFLPSKDVTLKYLNSCLKFINNNEKDNLDIVHLNGFRGIFKDKNDVYETVENSNSNNLEQYLLGLLDNYNQFRNSKPNYNDCIKYAWESDSKSLNKAKEIMGETDILVIVGYSFPSFNRKIDTELIREFESNSYTKIIYQDPLSNQDIINSIFENPQDVQIEKNNTNQFYIPHEFLFPSKGKEINL